MVMTIEEQNQELLRVKQRLKDLLEEKSRRISLPINAYQPDATEDRNQLKIHCSDAFIRLLFGGNQSGKSVAAAYEVSAWAMGIHRWLKLPKPDRPKHIYVVSAEYRTISAGIYRHIRSDGGDLGKGMKFIPKERIKKVGPLVQGPVAVPSYLEVWYGPSLQEAIKNNCYSKIEFITAKGKEEARAKVQGIALDLVAIDEEIDDTVWSELLMRLLAEGGRAIISATLVRSEPWLLELEDRFDEGDPDVVLVRLNSETSKHLDNDTRTKVFAKLTQDERDIRVLGKSARRIGLVFPEYGVKHIYDPKEEFAKITQESLGTWALDPPNYYLRVSSIDGGFNTFAALWAAVAPDKTIYFYRELYNHETTLYENCCDITRLEGFELKAQGQSINVNDPSKTTVYFTRTPLPNFYNEDPERLIDPAQLRMLEDGTVGVAAQLSGNYDMHLTPANNDVLAGVNCVNLLLLDNPLTGKPYIQVSKTLTNFHKEIRRYKYKKDASGVNTHANKIEPLRKNNHLMDNFRYICMHLMYGSDIFDQDMKDVKTHNKVHNFHPGTATSIEDRYKAKMNIIKKRGKVCHPWLGSEF